MYAPLFHGYHNGHYHDHLHHKEHELTPVTHYDYGYPRYYDSSFNNYSPHYYAAEDTYYPYSSEITDDLHGFGHYNHC